jgi:sugar phosphate isomerase/epimerase
MSIFRIGIQLASLRLPFKQALLTAGRLGAASVEIDAEGDFKPGQISATALREVRKLLDDANLRVASLRFATRRGYHVVEQLDRRVEATKAAMRLAYELRAPIVCNSIGRVPAEADAPDFRLLVEVLTDLGGHGTRTGARLAARTGTEEGASLARLIAALPEGAIAVDLDPAGLVVGGFSVEEAIRALGPHIAHVRARDAIRDRTQSGGQEVQLGRGSVDFPALLGGLENYAYRGDVTIERNHAADAIAEIGQAVGYLKSL